MDVAAADPPDKLLAVIISKRDRAVRDIPRIALLQQCYSLREPPAVVDRDAVRAPGYYHSRC